MTLALYRKYRPRSFSEIIGQEHVTEPLSQALRSGRLHHAYLFSGPRGCGKTSSARILARSLNCEKGPTPDPCGECDSCRALAPDGAGSIDVIEIDAASHGGVDDARDLRERAFFAPVSSRYKIYVIDEAHMVSSAGFNALLKLVEEPPEYVKFVFATTEPEKVLGTIKSRTHHYPFRLIPPAVLRPYLEQLAAAEGVQIEPAVIPLVVKAGGGSARDSLSVLDQLIAGAGPEGVSYARAVALLGVTDVALIDEVCDALAAGDGAAVYSTINSVAEAGHDARRFAGDLLERLRNLIVLQQVPGAIEKGLLDGADDELERMSAQAGQFGAATLSRMADIVHTGLTDMRGTTAPRLVLELIAARMLLPGADDSTHALLARMERMERRITLGDAENPQTEVVRPSAASVPAPPRPGPDVALPAPPSRSTPVAPPSGAAPVADASVAAARPATRPDSETGTVSASAAPEDHAAPGVSEAVSSPAPASRSTAAPAQPSAVSSPGAVADRSPATGAVDAAGIRRIWDEVLTLVRRKSPRAAAVVREATVRDVNGDVLVLVFKHPFHADALAASPALLQDALYEVLGGRWRISCEVAGQSTMSVPRPASVPSAPPPARPAPAAAPRQEVPATPAVEEDWPETATLGGSGADGGVVTVAAPAPAPVRPPAARPAARPSSNDEAWAGDDEPPFDPEFDGPVGTSAPQSPSVPPVAKSAPTAPPAAPAAPAAPVPAAQDHVGFDPGDEPVDDAVDPADRQSTEQQALDLLRDALGAEKISGP